MCFTSLTQGNATRVSLADFDGLDASLLSSYTLPMLFDILGENSPRNSRPRRTSWIFPTSS